MKKMMITTLASAFILCGGVVQAEVQKRNVQDFTSIKTEGAFVVNVQVGKTYSVEVDGTDKQIAQITTRVFGDELIIVRTNHKNSLKSSDDLTVNISVPEIKKFTMEGAGKTAIHNVQGDRFELHYEGVGLIELSGKVGTFKLKAEGIGKVDAKQLIANYVDAVVEGIGSVDVHAKDKLKASVQGIGSLTYFGNPSSVSKKVDGIGSVNKG